MATLHTKFGKLRTATRRVYILVHGFEGKAYCYGYTDNPDTARVRARKAERQLGRRVAIYRVSTGEELR